MHPARWSQYQELPLEHKQSYFDAVPALPKTEPPRRSSSGEQETVSTALQLSVAQAENGPLSVSVSPAEEALETTIGAADPLQTAVVTSSAAGREGRVRTFLLDRDVVEVALTELFRAGDGAGVSALFESSLDERDVHDRQKSDGTMEYRAVVRSVEAFDRVVALLAVGLSFEHTAAICQLQMGEQIGREPHDSTSVAHMALIAVGANLQALARVLQRNWAISLSLQGVDRRRAGETESHMFLDVRLRVCCSGKIKLFHLLTTPATNGDNPGTTGENLFDTTAKILLALDKRWLNKVIGCSIENGCAGPVSAIAVAFARKVEEQAPAGVIRVSCAQPRLDALLQRFVDSFLFADNAEWHGYLMCLMAYLQRQISSGDAKELSDADVAPCPRVLGMSWWDLVRVAHWCDSARVPIQQLLARRNASISPPPAWWINLKLILTVGSMAVKTRTGVEGAYMTVTSQQSQRISMLRLALAGDGGVEGPLPEYQRAALRDQSSLGEMIGSSDGMFAVKPHSIVSFIRSVGIWTAELFDALSAQERQKLIVGTADRVLELVRGLQDLSQQLEQQGGSGTTTPSAVLPHQLAKLDPVEFQKIIHLYQARLTGSFTDSELAEVDNQYRELQTAATSEATVRRLLELCAESPGVSFGKAWVLLRRRWKLLADFCGGLATAFPSTGEDHSAALQSSTCTATVESSHQLADFTLEARLQCQQFQSLQALDSLVGLEDVTKAR
ncbi:unnamed protein product [Phytophthora lilii]|uniref:Unnamed protein product n=1 Tax=Phytophthora lilii TaxID=2077276 RepID=A0A9W6TYX9_9STRA|nr:unnamed protein product [Phytophthora lilii]